MNSKDTLYWIEKDLLGIIKERAMELEPITAVELPKKDEIIKKGEPICIVESSKSAIELGAPFTLKVLKTNPNLFKKPIKTTKQKDLWICQFEYKKS